MVAGSIPAEGAFFGGVFAFIFGFGVVCKKAFFFTRAAQEPAGAPWLWSDDILSQGSQRLVCRQTSVHVPRGLFGRQGSISRT